MNKKYKIIKKIGEGKDGKVLLVKDYKNNKLFILKILSDYAKNYLFLTKIFLNKKINSIYFYNINILENNYILYDYENLKDIIIKDKSFLFILKQIADLEIELIKNNLYYWDLGFKHTNYLLDKDNKIKIIDYGGNAFLSLKKKDYEEFLNKKVRTNLGFTKDDLFAKVQFLLHIYYIVLNKNSKKNYSSISQESNREELLYLLDFCQEELKKTIYSDLTNLIIKNNIFEIDTWEKIKEQLDVLIKKDTAVDNLQEKADIDEISFFDKKVVVKGYQNFEIFDNNIKPIKKNSYLWNTEKKFKIVSKAFREIVKQNNNIDTFLDIGSNLGLYVFLAKLKFNFNKCYGIDYNQDYIDVCNKISNKLDITNCFFEKTKFSLIENKYDCVLAMGLIHHLFHRTEEFGSLDKILSFFSNITNKYLVVEFPTEKDPKAKKWTNISNRIKEEEYSKRNFVRFSKKYFKEIKKIDSLSSTRITYLLKK
jgi:hypothetical protein